MSGEYPPRPQGRRLSFSYTLLCSAALAFGSGATAAERNFAGTPKTAAPDGSAAEVAPALRQRLQSGQKQTFAIEFREHADLSAAYGMDWIERGRYVHRTLRAAAERSQANVRKMLDQRGAHYQSYWIKNAIVVSGGDLATLEASSAFAEVERIREVPKATLIKPKPGTGKAALTGSDGLAPNIAQVGADRVWAEGTHGDGVTVGVIDDGAFATHEALQRQYRGNAGNAGFSHDYNWFEPLGHFEEPRSSGMHGTHVLGTILGDNGATDPTQRMRTGMAPGAKWIACLGLMEDEGTDTALLGCGEFMLAPTKTDGSAADPDRRPQVVNNSWATNVCNGSPNDFYREVVENWIAAGLFPVFANGNADVCGLPEPPGLSTVASPASLGAAFAVGSTGNHDGLYAAHSLWGPSHESSGGLPHYPDPRGFPNLKPQVVAPGVNIVSSIGSRTDYGISTGTSMSAPHITGLVALMLEAGECLRGDYATLGTMIMQTARPVPYASGGSPPPGPGNVPNYATGWGEIDAPAAVDAAAHACGPQGFTRGVVTDANGHPVAGAKVEIFRDEHVRIYQSLTESDGSYVRRLPENTSGGYTVRISAYGYRPSSESGVIVQAEQTTRHDVRLVTATTYKIGGLVTDAATGWPLHAKVTVSGYPGAPVWTDPSTGRYSIQLAEGSHYRFDVESDIAGYGTQTREIGTIGGSAQDFTLSADPVSCRAPGYRFANTVLNEGFESGAALPAGWTRSSNGLGWLTGTQADLASAHFPVPAHGRFIASNDELGADLGEQNDASADYLVTPPLNLLGLSTPALTYRSFHYAGADSLARVQASTDGGTTWTALGVPTRRAETDLWTYEATSLAGVVSANTRIRFHASDLSEPGFGRVGPGWAIDDIAIGGGCVAPTGGSLVVGHVRDANTGIGLNGADVQVGSGDTVVSAASADPNLGDGFYTTYAPPGTPTVIARRGRLSIGYGEASATPLGGTGANALAELALPAGRLRVYPLIPTASVELGSTKSVPIDVANTGTKPLDFSFENAAIEEHFEGTFPPAGWTLTNATGGCVWAPINYRWGGNVAGGNGDAASIVLWPCNTGPDIDTSLISPPLDLASSRSASLGFFMSLGDGAGAHPRLDVDVSTDAGATWTTVFTEMRDNNSQGPGALIEADLSAFVGAHDVRVRFHYTAKPTYGSVMIDQVHLFNTVNSSAFLNLAPDGGSLAVGETRRLNATFDARSVAQPGDYEVQLRVAGNTPYAWALGDVTAKIHVTAPASWGRVVGTVRGLGHCDANPRVMPDAAITIADRNGTTHATTSDADGHYAYWLDSALGPYTLSVAAADHLTANGQATVVAGAAATADFGLRRREACVVTDPPTLEVQADRGQSVQQAFDLLNTGAADAAWTLRAGGNPDLKTSVPWVQTLSQEMEEGFGFGCKNPSFTRENSWMRKFDLSTRNNPGEEVLVNKVNFAVDNSSSSLTGTQAIRIRVHKLDGGLTFANLQLLGEKEVRISNGDMGPMSVTFDPPLSVASDSVLVAEISAGDGVGIGAAFFPGGNGGGETEPAYWASASCGRPEPIPFATIGFGWIHLILDIDTLASDPCGANATPADWLTLSATSGSIGMDSAVPLQAMLGGRPDGRYRGSMCLTPGRGGDAALPIPVPVTLSVGDARDAIFKNGFD